MSILLQVPPPPKNLHYTPVIVCLHFPIFFFFFWGGGGVGEGGQARGEDLIDMASPVVVILILHVHACPRVGIFDCGLESYKQTNQMLTITIMLLIIIHKNQDIYNNDKKVQFPESGKLYT